MRSPWGRLIPSPFAQASCPWEAGLTSGCAWQVGSQSTGWTLGSGRPVCLDPREAWDHGCLPLPSLGPGLRQLQPLLPAAGSRKRGMGGEGRTGNPGEVALVIEEETWGASL